MASDNEDDRPSRLPIVIYVLVGFLAVIGFFSIVGTIFSTVAIVIKAGFYLLIALGILWVLKSIFIGRSSKRSADSDA